MPRDLTLRKLPNIASVLPAMEHPYSCVGGEDYSLESIRRPILTDETPADAGNFPHNIQEHFWIREGENDGDSWLSLGVLDNGAYFFYTGSCDYTGFDCQGGMQLYVSHSWQTVLEHAMDEGEYELYVQQTVPASELEGDQGDQGTCVNCQQEPATMPNDYGEQEGRVCADCFWDMREDYRRWISRQSRKRE